ncbi:hypothetical protein [Rhodoferax sp. BAB1]|uniref:DUF6969 family protein n=1 Tax=Rhodoferax sp. BAB1 TaxID=2741720 RepID=UPI00157668E4|nr:hypothetical protein [Rhodoferax sp. BAB1]QKO20494.1 hypothetical protein HTY51_00635 [Rhodoferax sp. BAB1]
MSAAAQRVDTGRAAHGALARQLRLARQGRSMLFPFIGRSRRFEIWAHYPRHDAVDSSGRWQFYFHVHDRAEKDSARHPQEHGHIHLFRRSPQGKLTHFAGLALDARGLPLCWFATNQWVTGERWADAASLVRELAHFELRLRGPLSGAGLWLGDMVRFYATPLRQMLEQRDAALERHCRRHDQTRAQAWADRRVAVWSSLPVNWPQDALSAAGPLTQ